MKEYIPRIIDKTLQGKMKNYGVVIIEGCRWCGKSFTAKQLAASYIDLKELDINLRYEKPTLLLKGDKPRLLDSLEVNFDIWENIKRNINRTDSKGQYILTRSIKESNDDITSNGRVVKLLMRPMSLYESKESSGTVSLQDIIDGKEIKGVSTLSFDGLINAMMRGGWPKTLDCSFDNAYGLAKEYVNSILKEGIKYVDNTEDCQFLMQVVLENIAKNSFKMVSEPELLEEVNNKYFKNITRKTLDSYLKVLERLYILEYVPATSISMRAKTPLYILPKLVLVDPSIGVALLDLKKEDLVRGAKFTKAMFENLCIRDLKIYAESLGVKLVYYLDTKAKETAFILTMPDGKWGLVTIELDPLKLSRTIERLLLFKENVDSYKYGNPAFLMALTGDNKSYKRDDGVYVVAISALKN